jgi:hypothetical protein
MRSHAEENLFVGRQEMKTTRKLTRGMQATSAEILYSLVRCVEGMHMASHIVRRKPRSYEVRVKKSVIDGLALGFDNP